MSLLWIDGFDNYGNTTGSAPAPTGIVGRKYTVAGESSMRVRNGRLGHYSLNLPATATTVTKGSLTTNDTVVIGFAVYFTALGASTNSSFCTLLDGATTNVRLTINDVGNIIIYSGSSILATVTLGLSINTWYYFELKVKTATTTGTWELRLGQTVVSSGSGTTKSGSHDYSDGFMFTGSSFQQCYIDDLYFLDASGSYNTDFLGNMRIQCVYPNADGSSAQFTPSANASHYTLVDEAECDDDTTYIEDSVSGHSDLFNFEDITAIGIIKGVFVSVDCRETDANSFNFKIQCKSNSTLANGSSQVVGSTTYLTKNQLFELDPNTNTVWTNTDFNAAEFGIVLS